MVIDESIRRNRRSGLTRIKVSAIGVALALAGFDGAAQSLDSDLADALADEVARRIAEHAAERLADTVEQQVAADVADVVGGQIEADVVSTVEQLIEDRVADAIQRQAESSVEERIETSIDQVLESRLDAVVNQIDVVAERLPSTIESMTDRVEAAADRLEAATERVEARDVERLLSGGAAQLDGTDEPPATGDGQSPPAGPAEVAEATDRVFTAIEANGRAMERDVWVILVPSEYSERIESWGFNVRETARLVSMDRVLLRVDAPEDRDIAQAALDLALDAPGTLVDFNHVYAAEGSDSADVAARPAPLPAPRSAEVHVGAVRVGLVDSAVAAEHDAFRGADIEHKDFVSAAADRPLHHGTAVASILLRHAGADNTKLLAASVFFEDGGGNAIATTASLVQALEWLAGERAQVINMSLSGPPNRVLETVIDDVTSRGAVVVAAVGNGGPGGAPLYPAAYDSVIGVTALDSTHEIYRYATRGRQVTFAAPGVDVPAARSEGGYGAESGTSIAAPYAAAIIARSLVLAPRAPGEALQALKISAVDLGDRGFDDVYGFGLIVPFD